MKVLALLLAVCGTTLNALWPVIADANAVGIPGDICSANGPERQTRGENSGDGQNRSHRLMFGVTPPGQRLAAGTGAEHYPDQDAR